MSLSHGCDQAPQGEGNGRGRGGVGEVLAGEQVDDEAGEQIGDDDEVVQSDEPEVEPLRTLPTPVLLTQEEIGAR